MLPLTLLLLGDVLKYQLYDGTSCYDSSVGGLVFLVLVITIPIVIVCCCCMKKKEVAPSA